nr:hypothetical protein [Tanacetum cinerariifolium]
MHKKALKLSNQERYEHVGPKLQVHKCSSNLHSLSKTSLVCKIIISFTNEVPADFGVSTASPQVSTANLSDAIVYAFLADQPNGFQLVHEDLEQIHEDDLEEIDLKWQLALLSMRAKRMQSAKEPGEQNQESRRTVNVEDTSSKAMVAIDGASFDWSYMADDEAPTNMAFIALSGLEYDELRVEVNKSKCHLADYKRGLTSVEEQPVHYQMNERLSNLPNEPPLREGNTSRSGEGSIQILELMAMCIKLLDKVTHLEYELTSTKAIYNKALITLTKRVKKLEMQLKHKRSRAVIDSSKEKEAILDHEDSPKQGRMIEEIDKDKNVNLVKSSEQGEAHETVKHRMDLSTASQIDDDETLAETFVEYQKKKEKLLCKILRSPKKIKKKEMMQISLDEEIAQRFYEEEQAQILRDEEYAQQIPANEDLAQRMLEEEKGSLSIKERSTLLAEFIDKRNKMMAAKRAKEKRNKPPTQAQQRTYKSNYLKNMGGDVGYYDIHKADGSYKTYIFFSEMLNDFDREYLIVLYRLFNEMYAFTRPGFDDLMLWGDMKIMFKAIGDDEV